MHLLFQEEIETDVTSKTGWWEGLPPRRTSKGSERPPHSRDADQPAGEPGHHFKGGVSALKDVTGWVWGKDQAGQKGQSSGSSLTLPHEPCCLPDVPEVLGLTTVDCAHLVPLQAWDALSQSHHWPQKECLHGGNRRTLQIRASCPVPWKLDVDTGWPPLSPTTPSPPPTPPPPTPNPCSWLLLVRSSLSLQFGSSPWASLGAWTGGNTQGHVCKELRWSQTYQEGALGEEGAPCGLRLRKPLPWDVPHVDLGRDT